MPNDISRLRSFSGQSEHRWKEYLEAATTSRRILLMPHRWTCAFIGLVLLSGCATQAGNSQCPAFDISHLPPNCRIDDSQTAIRLAYAYWWLVVLPGFDKQGPKKESADANLVPPGENSWLSEFTATLSGGWWEVTKKVPPGTLGGGLSIRVRQRNGNLGHIEIYQ